jgi:uncharacterized protein (TIGR03083 family)
MDNDGVFKLIAIERRRAADMFEGLSDAQLSERSLCAEWTVRDIAGHMISPFRVSTARFLLSAALSGGFNRYSAKLARTLGQEPVDRLIATLRENADHRFTPPGNGPEAPLSDISIHTRDVARPLGLKVSAPLATWQVVLDFLMSPKAVRGFLPKGATDALRFAATDQDWSAGTGPEVSGPSEALALAIAGRKVALEDLSGEGLSELRSRLR